jgi:von Willebrand factor type A domain/Aerotolerance regulator N-terminal
MALRPPGWKDYLARSWFPLALVALLVLAIPSAVLLALNIFDLQGTVNDWLQGNFSLSYHLPVAWWLGLILLLVPVLIALLYFLKLKRKPLSVPSTFLWRKSIEDLHVNALFQWLRQNVLLLLQLLAVLVLIYAFMDFRVHGRTTVGKHYILMIDNSASMSATDVAPNRLDWAKKEALKAIDAATDQDYGMVIVFNSSAEIRQSYTNNRGVLRRAVEDVQPTQRPTRIEEALSLADSLANPARSTDDNSVRPANVEPGTGRTYVPAEGVPTEIHLFSDGRFADMPEFSLGNLNVQFHAAGKLGPENANNVGLVRLNAQRDDDDPSKLQVFARVLNFRPGKVAAEVQLDVQVEGQLKGVYTKDVLLPGRIVTEEKIAGKDEPLVRDTPGEGSVTFSVGDLDENANVILHARVKGYEATDTGGKGAAFKDDFALDDEAWMVAGVVRKARVLIVGERNDVLSAFFDDTSTAEVANVTRLYPADLKKDVYRKPARNGDYDLVVFDRCGPERDDDMPRANTFFIGYPPPPWTPGTVEKLTGPPIRGWMGKHPILKYLVALQEIGIAEGFRIKDLPPRTPRLIESDQNTSLMFTLSRDAYTDLVQTFSIINEKGEWNTNWPLHPSFPLFLRNVLYTLGNVSDGSSEELVQPGQVKTIRPEVTVAEVRVGDPDGKTHAVTRGNRPSFTFGDTEKVGVYRVGWADGWQRNFAVNLLDPDESNIEPRSVFQIGDVAVRAGKDSSQPRELWKWLVLAALGLLLAEWYIYNRRVYV